jgi:hypothetical protein
MARKMVRAGGMVSTVGRDGGARHVGLLPVVSVKQENLCTSLFLMAL